MWRSGPRAAPPARRDRVQWVLPDVPAPKSVEHGRRGGGGGGRGGGGGEDEEGGAQEQGAEGPEEEVHRRVVTAWLRLQQELCRCTRTVQRGCAGLCNPNPPHVVALFGPRLGGCKLLGGLHLIGTAELGFLFSRAAISA